MCHYIDGMRNANYVRTPHIKTSSTKKGKKPYDVRPGGPVWSSTKGDKNPRIEVRLGDQAVDTRSVRIIRTHNVRVARVVFHLDNKKTITKVSIANSKMFLMEVPYFSRK